MPVNTVPTSLSANNLSVSLSPVLFALKMMTSEELTGWPAIRNVWSSSKTSPVLSTR